MNGEILDGLLARSDLVYHLAAVVGVEHYVGDPYQVLNVNINGTQAVLKAAYKHNRKVILASTSEVYGRNPRIPFSEDDDRVLGSTRRDRWCYATSKAAAEHFCFAYQRLGLPVVILRYFNVYGPRLDQLDVGRVVTIFMGQLLRPKRSRSSVTARRRDASRTWTTPSVRRWRPAWSRGRSGRSATWAATRRSASWSWPGR